MWPCSCVTLGVCDLVWKAFAYLFAHVSAHLWICSTLWNAQLCVMCSCVSWLRHYASSFFICFTPKELVICVLHVAVFFPPCLPTSFISNTLTNSIHRASTCLVPAKIAFLLCRSKGLCCDKSDSLIEQLSGLLDYLSVIWLVTDLWTAEWLATFQSGWQTDWLSALFTGCKSDYLSVCLESLIECVAGKVTGCPVISL